MAQVKRTSERRRRANMRQRTQQSGKNYVAHTVAEALNAPGGDSAPILQSAKVDSQAAPSSEVEIVAAMLAQHHPGCWHVREQVARFLTVTEHSHYRRPPIDFQEE